MNKVYYLLLMLFGISNCYAQLDFQCNGSDKHSVYLVSSVTGMIYRVDSVDTNPSSLNPVQIVPNNTIGISINSNLDSVSWPTTMYYVNDLSYYYYWNGNGWSNTGHTSGTIYTENIGGTSDFIFGLDSNIGYCDIYRYDGTSNGTYLTTIPGSTITADVATDSLGNFYLHHFVANKIVAYTSAGTPIDSFYVKGSATSAVGGAGFALLGNKFYYDNRYELHEGTIIGDTVDFTLIVSHPNIFCNDIAVCPTSGFPVAIFESPEQPRLIIYPNPTNDFALIKLNKTSVLKVYNYLGRLIQVVSVNGLSEFLLDVGDFDSGIYFITAISNDNNTVTSKLLVQ